MHFNLQMHKKIVLLKVHKRTFYTIKPQLWSQNKLLWNYSFSPIVSILNWKKTLFVLISHMLWHFRSFTQSTKVLKDVPFKRLLASNHIQCIKYGTEAFSVTILRNELTYMCNKNFYWSKNFSSWNSLLPIETLKKTSRFSHIRSSELSSKI